MTSTPPRSASASAPDRIPPGVHGAVDYALLAARHMDAAHHAYVAGGSGHGVSAQANLRAFDGWAVLPRLLRDVRHGHVRTVVAGEAWEHPMALAPVAFQTLAHPHGEIATARAAEATGTCMVASTLSSCTLESIAQASGPARWFQLYFQPRPDDTLQLVRRAEAAGYRALVVTLDAALQTAGRRALDAGFRMPEHCVAENLRGQDPLEPPALAPGQGRVFHAMHFAPTWADLDWLLAHTNLPVWVKGVMHPDDATALKARGVAGVVVSNHGGRGLDGAPASLQMLPAVRAAVGPGWPVLFDGGIRSGTDVFKALALGADAVLIGRLQVYALAVAGALGVAHLLRLLAEELQACMALAGCATLADIGPSALIAQPLSLHPSLPDSPC